jgi:multidrug resistance protein, MATE family
MLLLGLISTTGYIERLLLAEYSTAALAGSLNGFFLARVFQAACLSVIVIGQAYVGLYHGAGQHKNIGSCVWQLIWFSIISIAFVTPIGFLSEEVLFSDTSIESAESGYFALLCGFNFLYPLGSALSAFYLGRGITLPIVLMTVGACLLNIGLDVLLIFGYHWIPEMGATGAAIGRVAAQGTLCIILLFLFLSRYNRETYGTNIWSFSPKLFWHYVRPGILRALAAFPALGDWVVVSRFMSLKSEAHLLVFSLGSTIFYFLMFVGDGLFQTMVTVSSNQIGKKEYSSVWKSLASGLVIIATAGLVLTIPFFIFPQTLVYFFNSASSYPQLITIYHEINHWLWLTVIAYSLNALSLGVIVASRDTLFLLCYYFFFWLVSFAPVYITMELLGWSADKFWLIVMFSNIVCSVTFLWRASKEKWSVDNWQPQLPATEMNPPLTSSM